MEQIWSWGKTSPVPSARGGLGGFCSSWLSLSIPGLPWQDGDSDQPLPDPFCLHPALGMCSVTLCAQTISKAPCPLAVLVVPPGPCPMDQLVPGRGQWGCHLPGPQRSHAHTSWGLLASAQQTPHPPPEEMPVLPIGNSAPHLAAAPQFWWVVVL